MYQNRPETDLEDDAIEDYSTYPWNTRSIVQLNQSSTDGIDPQKLQTSIDESRKSTRTQMVPKDRQKGN